MPVRTLPAPRPEAEAGGARAQRGIRTASGRPLRPGDSPRDVQIVMERRDQAVSEQQNIAARSSTRRAFLETWLLGLPALGLVGRAAAQERAPSGPPRRPLVVSTWSHGVAANAAAWAILQQDGVALDAVENGVRVTEADPEVDSVGLGGLPDRDGKVTLDACIMNGQGQCGSVVFLEHVMHPTSVARRVMERTPHVVLAGEGALRFALDEGFKKENLLTPKAEAAWKQWCKEHSYAPARTHDTIGMLAIDGRGSLAGACTTSGLAFKMHGRVGDSPLIGAGLYVDDEVGAACATGLGEAVIRVSGSFLIVELMRRGLSPADACREAVGRVITKTPDQDDLQVGFLALNRSGEIGACSVRPGFQFAVHDAGGKVLQDAPSRR